MSMVLLILLVVCVISDIRERRIPNAMIVVGLVIALGIIPLLEGVGAEVSWTSKLLGALAGLALFMPMYLLRAMGAGDVKLLAMVGGFVGIDHILTVALYSMAAGGVLSLVFMLARGVAAQTLSNLRFLLITAIVKFRSGTGARFEPMATTTVRLPYAVAIASGTLITLLVHGLK